MRRYYVFDPESYFIPRALADKEAAGVSSLGTWLGVALLWLMAAPLAVPAVASEGFNNQQLQALWHIWRGGNRTTAQVLDRYGDVAEERLKPYFVKEGVPYPPERVTLVALKEEKLMELWAWHDKKWRHIRDFKIQGASGHAGPKLREGDKQVPEGQYRITLLNPNSRYHLSMKLNYPNSLDQKYAGQDGRSRLGGNIFIHGTEYSIGCLAMGDPAIQELYVLAAKTGLKNIEVLIAPYDLRFHKPVKYPSDPDWVDGLYAEIKQRMVDYPRAKPAPKPVPKVPAKPAGKEKDKDKARPADPLAKS